MGMVLVDRLLAVGRRAVVALGVVLRGSGLMGGGARRRRFGGGGSQR